MTRCCLFVSAVREQRAGGRRRRRKGRIEKAEKEQAPPARRSAIRGVVFAPAFGACPFFFHFGRLCAPTPAASTLRVSHRLGTCSFVKFYDGPPLRLVSIMLYPLRTVRPFLFTNFVLITGSSSWRGLRRARVIARKRALNDFTHRSENIPVY